MDVLPNGDIVERESVNPVAILVAIFPFGVLATIAWALAVGFAIAAWDIRALSAALFALLPSWLFFMMIYPVLFPPNIVMNSHRIEMSIPWSYPKNMIYEQPEVELFVPSTMRSDRISFRYSDIESIVPSGIDGSYKIALTRPITRGSAGARTAAGTVTLAMSAEFRAELERRVQAARPADEATPA